MMDSHKRVMLIGALLIVGGVLFGISIIDNNTHMGAPDLLYASDPTATFYPTSTPPPTVTGGIPTASSTEQPFARTPESDYYDATAAHPTGVTQEPPVVYTATPTP